MWNVLRLCIHFCYFINLENNKVTLYGYTVTKKLMGLHITALVFSLIQAILLAPLLTNYCYKFVDSSVRASGLCSQLTKILCAVL
jgi:hypothetical protein